MNAFATWWTDLAQNPAGWPFALTAGLLLAVAGLLLERGAYALFHRVTASTTTHLDDLLVKRMRPAARTLVLLGVAHLVLHLRGDRYPNVEVWISIVEWLLGAYLLIEAAETLVFDWHFKERKGVEIPTVLRQLVLVTLYSSAVLTTLGTLAGLSLAPILATGSVLTVVLGFALQDTLGNLFAGLALQAESAVALGEWILVDGVEGQVVDAGWRSTHLRTFSGDIVSIPNAMIAKTRNQNFNRPEKATGRNLEFLVRPDASPEAVERACRAALARAPLALASHPKTKFWFVAVHPLYQRWILRCWVADFGVHDDMESDVLKALWHTLREEGIAMDPAAVVPGYDPDQPAAVAVPPRAAG